MKEVLLMPESLKEHPKLKEFIELMEELNPNALWATGLEPAILGYIERIGSDPLIVLSREKCLELMTSEGMTEEEAIENFEYNVIGSWNGDGTPVFMTTIDEAVL
jgi:hypothetical protein